MWQFKSIESWAASKPQLWELLSKDVILFGEWMYAKHSIHYTRLPDYFIAFDIYDRKTGTATPICVCVCVYACHMSNVLKP
jgi:hypothetical protein